MVIPSKEPIVSLGAEIVRLGLSVGRQAKQVYNMLIERLAKFGLEMEQDKTRILPFGRYKGTNETFDFLGFMHYNDKTRTGKYTVGHKMSKKKRKLKHKSITKWIKEYRAFKFKEIIELLNKKLIGLYAYYGINGMLQELYKYMLLEVIYLGEVKED